MPRIRTLKPEFWADEKMAPMDDTTRLVFLALISMADDAGRVIDSVRQIDAFIWPFDETLRRSSGESLEILRRASRIIRYTSESGQPLIQIANWDKHQKVKHASKYVLPAPSPEDLGPQQFSESSGDPPESLRKASGKSPDSIMDHGSWISTDTSKSAEPIVDLWNVWIEELGGRPPHPRLTEKRRKVLRSFFREHLQGEDDPAGEFRKVLSAVQKSEHHMSTRAYQMPESLFRNPERRDTWRQAAKANGKKAVGMDALMSRLS